MCVNKLIPKPYWPIVSCSVELRNSEIDVAIYTTSGQLLTFCKYTPINYCNVNCDDMSSMHLFYTYEPFTEYFLLRSIDQLIVVKNGPQLDLIEKFQNVTKFEISDYWEYGTPQVAIWTNTSDEPYITDFINIRKSSDESRKFLQPICASSLNDNLKNLIVRLDNGKKILEEKIIIRKQIISEFFNNASNENLYNDDLIMIGNPVKKIYNKKFSILLPIQNRSKLPLCNIHITIHTTKHCDLYSTRYFVLNRKFEQLEFKSELKNDDYFTEIFDRTLLPNSRSYAVISFDISQFSDDNLIYPLFMFNYENNPVEMKLKIAEISFFTVDIYCNSLYAMGELTTLRTYDILSVISVCECLNVVIKLVQRLYKPIWTILVENLQFCSIKKYNYFYHASPAYNGILIRIEIKDPFEFLFTIYAKDVNDHMLFIKSLWSLLPLGSKIMLDNIDSENSDSNEVENIEFDLKTLLEACKVQIRNLE